MRYLHTMVRVTDIDASLDFYCDKLGLEEVRRHESEKGRFTLIFLAAPEDKATSTAKRAPELELTYNWDPEVYTGGRNFGHLAYKVDDIYATCQRADGCRRDDQPAAARRQHGLRQVARQYLDRAPAGRRAPAPAGALAVHAQHRQLVAENPLPGASGWQAPVTRAWLPGPSRTLPRYARPDRRSCGYT